MALYLSYFDTRGDFFFLYVLQLASERVWRENESASRLGSNVFIDWHVWGCGTFFLSLSQVSIACHLLRSPVVL